MCDIFFSPGAGVPGRLEEPPASVKVTTAQIKFCSLSWCLLWCNKSDKEMNQKLDSACLNLSNKDNNF